MAAALTCAKLVIPVAHVEAGLRSFDDTMPEEINRRVTDLLSDPLFVTAPEGEQNLAREGISGERVVFVGNRVAEVDEHAVTIGICLAVILGAKLSVLRGCG